MIFVLILIIIALMLFVAVMIHFVKIVLIIVTNSNFSVLKFLSTKNKREVEKKFARNVALLIRYFGILFVDIVAIVLLCKTYCQ